MEWLDHRMASFYHDCYGPVASTTEGSFLSRCVTSHCLRNTQEISQFPVTYSVGWWVNKSTHGTNRCSLRKRRMRQQDISHKDLDDTERLYSSFYLLTGEGGGGGQLQRDNSILATKMGKTGTITNKITRNVLNRTQRTYKNGRSLIIEYPPLHGVSWKKSSTSFPKQGGEKYRSRGKHGKSTEDTKTATARNEGKST